MLKLIFLLSAVSGIAQSVDLSEKIATANRAFDTGDYRQAVVRYQEVIADGHHNGHVYYNLGVSYHRLQEIGESMASLLAARHYLPRDPDVVFNLKFVEDRISDKLGTVMPRKFYEVLDFISDYLSEYEISFATLAFIGLGLLLLTLYLFHRQFLFLMKLGVLLLAVVVLSLIYLQIKARFPEQWGAIVSPSTKVYSGPGDSNMTLFILQEGAPFVIEQEANGFLKIKLSDGKKGWVSVDSGRSFLPQSF